MLLLSEVIEIICLQITLWAGGNLKPRAGGGGSGDNVELVRAQGSIISESDGLFFFSLPLFAIPNADTEERRIAGKHRIPGRQLPYQIPRIARVTVAQPDGYYAAALLSCCD